jgi:23S rRNA pseudouridine1911/1915/1917 synthase
MIRDWAIVVDAISAGMRLDRFLAQRADCPRAIVLEAIAAGRIRLNGRLASKGEKLERGDRLHVEELAQRADVRAAPDPSVPLSILHEDADLIVLDKPAGIPVHPLRLDELGTLANGLVARHPELAELGDRPLMAALLHRIDTDTSGIVLAARSAGAYSHVRGQFRRHEVEKTYLALVHGEVTSPGRIRSGLIHDRADRGRMIVASEKTPRRHEEHKPLLAVTSFRPLRQNRAECTLLEVTIFTGVTHQIRCQLAHLGHPIIGDRTYGLDTPMDRQLPRHFLHAAAIALTHPGTNQSVRFECPLPRELEELLRKLCF